MNVKTQLISIDCNDSTMFKSGSENAEQDTRIWLNVEIVYEFLPFIFRQQNQLMKNPLHLAFESGNLNKALQILDVIRQNTELCNVVLN